MKTLLEHLRIAEGDTVHYLDGEKDITAPYGIYKYAHPDAKIFHYIEEIADVMSVDKKSAYWHDKDLEKVNATIDTIHIKNLASEFYEEYLKNAHLELFPNDCKVAMFDMYTNSPKGAWWSVQESIKQMKSTGKIIFEKSISKSDGSFGQKTDDALYNILVQVDGTKFGGVYFETMMISNMRVYYDKIIDNNEALEKFEKGWNNRMSHLQSI